MILGHLFRNINLSKGFLFIRSRPVVHVIREISIEPQYIDLTQHNCPGNHGVWLVNNYLYFFNSFSLSCVHKGQDSISEICLFCLLIVLQWKPATHTLLIQTPFHRTSVRETTYIQQQYPSHTHTHTTHVHINVSVLLPTSALGIHFEADVDRRKLSLPHRVHFLERSVSEPEYVHSVEVELRGQKHLDCQTVTFAVKVRRAEIEIIVCFNSVLVVSPHFCCYFTRKTF